MELLGLYARGLAIGFAIAAAIGPISMLCIRRTLAQGPRVGLASGMGAATADAAYAAVAAFGLTAIQDLLVSERRILGIAGGAFLVLLALRAAVRPASVEAGAVPGVVAARGIGVGYASTLGLTITNPMTILSFAAAFVGLGLVGHGGAEAAASVLGVFTGSGAWWVVLVGAVSVYRARIGPAGLRRTAWASAVLTGALGIVAIGATLAAT